MGSSYPDLIRRILHVEPDEGGVEDVSRRRTRVAVLYNAPMLPPDHPDSASEADVAEVARVVAEGLVRHGFDAWPSPAAPPVGKVLGQLANPTPDVVFNLIEGFGGRSIGEAHVTGMLELLGLPYTGCPPEAQALCHSKARTKALLRGFGLPTAPFDVVRSGEPVPRWSGPWPAILKPEAEDASLGIDQSSVVRTPEAIVEGVARLRVEPRRRRPDRGVSARPRVQRRPPGPPRARGLARGRDRLHVPAGSWPILTYAAKWAEGSAEDLASRPRCPAEVEPGLAERLSTLAVEAFRATGCRDYARVDFRLDAEGSPMILEVNPNPDIGPSAGWAQGAPGVGTRLRGDVGGSWSSRRRIGGRAMAAGDVSLRDFSRRPAGDRPHPRILGRLPGRTRSPSAWSWSTRAEPRTLDRLPLVRGRARRRTSSASPASDRSR